LDCSPGGASRRVAQLEGGGKIEKLKANYRRALARDGYALVKSGLAVFKPEA
jgi:uncharacterized protein YjhX (UPF0386 family)